MNDSTTFPEGSLLFGRFEKPELLRQLEDYERIPGHTWEYLGFYVDLGAQSSITPLDVIPFAGTGGNGCHFGFLTDFAVDIDFSTAPIVGVDSTDDPPVRLIARNIRDFLRLISAAGEAELLMQEYESHDALIEDLDAFDKVSEVDWKGNRYPEEELTRMRLQKTRSLEQREHLRVLLRDAFRIEPVADVPDYLREIRMEREAVIGISTLDGLGIIVDTPCGDVQTYEHDTDDESAVTEWLHKASSCERLRFYRDATYRYILDDDYHAGVRGAILTALEWDGLGLYRQNLGSSI